MQNKNLPHRNISRANNAIDYLMSTTACLNGLKTEN